MKVAGVIPFKAKPGQGEELARLVAAAKPHVDLEKGTLVWLVLRSNTDPDTVFLVDTFADAGGRDVHMRGEAAKQILSTVGPLLAQQPDLHPADLVAEKLA